jgi:hypothetical protein
VFITLKFIKDIRLLSDLSSLKDDNLERIDVNSYRKLYENMQLKHSINNNNNWCPNFHEREEWNKKMDGRW